MRLMILFFAFLAMSFGSHATDMQELVERDDRNQKVERFFQSLPLSLRYAIVQRSKERTIRNLKISSSIFDSRVIHFEPGLLVMPYHPTAFYLQEVRAFYGDEQDFLPMGLRNASSYEEAMKNYARQSALLSKEYEALSCIERDLEGGRTVPRGFHLLNLQKELIGFVLFEQNELFGGEFEKATYISPKFRGRGFGTLLGKTLVQFIDTFKGWGILRLEANTFKQWEREKEVFLSQEFSKVLPTVSKIQLKLSPEASLENFSVLSGYVTLKNVASIYCNQKIGFVPVGPVFSGLQDSQRKYVGLKFQYPAQRVSAIDQALNNFKILSKALPGAFSLRWETNPEETAEARLAIYLTENPDAPSFLFGEYIDVSGVACVDEEEELEDQSDSKSST